MGKSASRMGPLHTAAADGSLTGITPDGDTLRVREVWADNLEDEMQVRERGFFSFLSKNFRLCGGNGCPR